ncbi:hypothetical protein [uncultured Enterococcus sp.]|uniref:hypothetical protein n=1 Tax=uncultured Enterococcus sp. TaxID=167972 RepID=UPI002AA6019A|nr:hypothetical protein [uncultured Enterococcus sp.]
MSIDVYLVPGASQAASVVNLTNQRIEEFERMKAAIDLFVNNEELQSEAYNSAKTLFRGLVKPLLDTEILLCQLVADKSIWLTVSYGELVLGALLSGRVILKSDELEAEIESLNGLINEAIRLRYQYKNLQMFKESYEQVELLNEYWRCKVKLTEQLTKLRTLEESCPNQFLEIETVSECVRTGIEQINGSWNPQSGTFELPSLSDLSWITTARQSAQKRYEEKAGIDHEKNEQLKQYDVYAVVYKDANGEFKVTWKILDEKGMTIDNPELFKYLSDSGRYLDIDLFKPISYGTWKSMLEEAFREGYHPDLTQEKDDNPLTALGLSSAQGAADMYEFLTEDELMQALITLFNAYESYKGYTAPNYDPNKPITMEESVEELKETIEGSIDNSDSNSLSGDQVDGVVNPPNQSINTNVQDSLDEAMQFNITNNIGEQLKDGESSSFVFPKPHAHGQQLRAIKFRR